MTLRQPLSLNPKEKCSGKPLQKILPIKLHELMHAGIKPDLYIQRHTSIHVSPLFYFVYIFDAARQRFAE